MFHIHAHLTVFVDGKARRVPCGIAVPGAQVSSTPIGSYVAAGSCFYWLHTHAADGIIHIEAPVQRTYTLGDFFDVGEQKLSPSGELGFLPTAIAVVLSPAASRGTTSAVGGIELQTCAGATTALAGSPGGIGITDGGMPAWWERRGSPDNFDRPWPYVSSWPRTTSSSGKASCACTPTSFGTRR